MSKQDIIAKIVAEHLGVKEVKHGRTMGDLGADSLDVIEIVMAVETEFGIVIPDDVVNDGYSVDSLAAWLESSE